MAGWSTNRPAAARRRGRKTVLPAPFPEPGRTPPASSFLRAQKAHGTEEIFSLATAFYPDCSMVQLTDTIAPESSSPNFFIFQFVFRQFPRTFAASG